MRRYAWIILATTACRGWLPGPGTPDRVRSTDTEGTQPAELATTPDGDTAGTGSGTDAGSDSSSEVWDTEPIEVPCGTSAVDCTAITAYSRDLGVGLEPMSHTTTFYDGCSLAFEQWVDDDVDGTTDRVLTWSRNAARQPVEQTEALADGEVYLVSISTYDPVGHLVRTDDEYFNVPLLYWAEHTWVDGLRVRLQTSISDGHVEFEHDADGNEVLWRELDRDGDEVRLIVYHWDDDDDGVPRLTRTDTDHDANGQVDLIVHDVWAEGLRIEKTVDSDADGTVDLTWEYGYDDLGRRVDQRSVHPTDGLQSESLTTWDCPG